MAQSFEVLVRSKIGMLVLVGLVSEHPLGQLVRQQVRIEDGDVAELVQRFTDFKLDLW